MTWPMSMPLSGALALVLTVAIGAFAAGAWTGAKWQLGTAAVAERLDLRRQIDSLDAAALALRRRGLAVAQDFRTAQIHFEATAEGLSDDLVLLDAAFAARLADIESLVAAHPEWGDCRIGAGGVHAWNAAAVGADFAAGATTGNPGAADAAVPGDAADADGRQPAGAAAQLPGGRTAVPPLPMPHGAIDAGVPNP